MRFFFPKTLLAIGLAAMSLSQISCGHFTSLPTKYEASTRKDETHFEVVPDAKITIDTTRPVWELGRNAFVPGIDRLLVITRIGSVLPKSKLEKDRYNAVYQRAWITIPVDTPIGKVVKISDLSLKQTGYDVNVYHQDTQSLQGYFRHSCKINGIYRIISEDSKSMTLDLMLDIEPSKQSSQNRWTIKKRVVVPLYSQGKYATKSSQFLDTVTQAAQKKTKTKLGFIRKDLHGQWQGKSAAYQYNAQFDAEGTFQISVGKAYKIPGIFSGTYKLIDNILILKTTQIKFEDDVLAMIRYPLQRFTIDIKDKALTLTGKILFRQDKLETLSLTKKKYDPQFIKTAAEKQDKDPAQADVKSDTILIDVTDPDYNLRNRK